MKSQWKHLKSWLSYQQGSDTSFGPCGSTQRFFTCIILWILIHLTSCKPLTSDKWGSLVDGGTNHRRFVLNSTRSAGRLPLSFLPMALWPSQGPIPARKPLASGPSLNVTHPRYGTREWRRLLPVDCGHLADQRATHRFSGPEIHLVSDPDRTALPSGTSACLVAPRRRARPVHGLGVGLGTVYVPLGWVNG